MSSRNHRFNSLIRCAGILACVAVSGFLGAPQARADAFPPNTIVFHVEASNTLGSGTYDVPASALTYIPSEDRYTWTLPLAVDIENPDGDVIATLTGGTVAYVGDPQVALGFAVVAGPTVTTFTITSAVATFPLITTPSGRASAGFTVTDSFAGDGAALVGAWPPAYLASYNGPTPGGTVFAGLIPGVTAGPGGTNVAAANFPLPPGTYLPIGVPVSSMSAGIHFTLTAGDQAAGTSNWEIIPEPASLVLLALGLVLRRR